METTIVNYDFAFLESLFWMKVSPRISLDSLLTSNDCCRLLITFYKQFGPRLGSTKRQACFGSNLIGNLMVFLKENLKKVNFEEKNQKTTKACRISQYAMS